MLSAEMRFLPWNPTSIPTSMTAATIHPENLFFIARPLLVQQYYLFFQRQTGEGGSSPAIVITSTTLFPLSI
jgi:hypothetical protein